MDKKNITIHLTLLFLLINCRNMIAELRPKDNGDIYVRQSEDTVNAKILGNEAEETSTKLQATNFKNIDVEGVMKICNASFSIPMDYVVQFNTTGELPDTTDKTGMCYIRCFFETAGLIENWKLNRELLMSTIWSVTAESIEFCGIAEKNEMNACVRLYAIAKCLMKGALDNMRN